MNQRILFIDDEQEVVDLFDRMLSDEGFDVTATRDGKMAIDMFRSTPFDLLITDLKLPEIQGPEIIKQIREIDPKVEIIVLSGNVFIEEASKTLEEYDIYSIQSKPIIEIDDFLMIIEKALEKRRSVYN